MIGAPNILAFLALICWPIAAIILFRKLPFERAIIWSILLPYLFLPPPPAGFDFPLLPPLEKQSIPNIATLAICVFMLRRPVSFLPASPLARFLLLLFVINPIATVLTNLEPVVFGVLEIPALRVHDSISAVVTQSMFLLPFFLGRQFLASESAQRELLLALMVGGVIYSGPILLEARLAPQLNIWIYGYFQHDWQQMVRQGGFRPIVFLYHGIWVAFLIMTCMLAAIALWRATEGKLRIRYLAVAGWLAAMLVLCKTIGALLYGIVLAPLIWLFGQRMQIRVAALFAVIAIAYPMLRGADFVPIEAMIEGARTNFGEERAGSLGYRFHMEGLLLERASEKPLFGWGGWGRGFLYNLEDGSPLTVVDGLWVGVIGTYGWLGYIVQFGLLALPIFLMLYQARRIPAQALSPYVGPLAIMLGINMVDLLPNATLIPMTWLMAGALLGHAEALATGRDVRASNELVSSQSRHPRTIL